MGHMGEDWMEGVDDDSILKEIEETSGPVSRWPADFKIEMENKKLKKELECYHKKGETFKNVLNQQ